MLSAPVSNLERATEHFSSFFQCRVPSVYPFPVRVWLSVRSGLLAVASRSSIFSGGTKLSAFRPDKPHCHLELQGLLGFEPQLLSYRLAVKVCVLRADLIALNLSEGSPRIGDRPTGRRGAVHKRTGVGTV